MTPNAAINARDFNAAGATMAPDVAWLRAFKGGVVRGHHDVRSYWTEQWSEIDPHVEPVSFNPEGEGESWSMCIKSCATWTGPFLVMNTLAIVLPSKTP